jgi:hypothetical protein
MSLDMANTYSKKETKYYRGRFLKDSLSLPRKREKQRKKEKLKKGTIK